jgi:putative heme transporter
VARLTRPDRDEAGTAGTTDAGARAADGDPDERTTGLAGAPAPESDGSEAAAAGDEAERLRIETAAAARPRWDRWTDPGGDRAVPRGVQVTAAWAWRIVAVAGAAYVVLWVIARLQVVVVPLAIALLISALLQPAAAALAKRGAPPALATVVAIVGGIVAIALLVWLVISQFRDGLGELTNDISRGVDEIRDWLVNGPLGLSDQQLDNAITSARETLNNNRSTLTSGALGAATTVGHVLTGALLALFATFFFVKDGRRIWTWVVRLFPRESRERVLGAGDRAWRTLISYIRATLAVAFVDAVGIGLGAVILGLPLALPLAVIVFLGAFIPIVGATLSGLVAVLVALVAKGPAIALIMLGIVLLVQQLEGHVLQPLLLGRAVSVHPLAVVFAIATGTLLAGIVGALLAVPIVACANTIAAYLSREGRTLVPTESADEIGARAPTGT